MDDSFLGGLVKHRGYLGDKLLCFFGALLGQQHLEFLEGFFELIFDLEVALVSFFIGAGPF